ncbi:MAG: Hsp70 family protein, partial [Cellulomonadaceae bacterium]|nr:Hsp70 family protein [Cellulomonadaceae bacterium]
DKKRREDAELRNQAENLAYSTDKVLAENGDKVPDDVKAEVTAAVGELRTALAGDDIEAVKAKNAALAAVSQKIGEAIYKADADSQAAAADGAPQDTPSASSDEDVVDAEIVDEDEAK